MQLKSCNCLVWQRNIASSLVGGMQNGGSGQQELENASRDKAASPRQPGAILASQGPNGAALSTSCSLCDFIWKCLSQVCPKCSS